MKRFRFVFSVVMIMMAIVFNFCKTEDNPDTVIQKKCAWVSGRPDSTGYGMILYSDDGGENWVRQGEGNPSLLGVHVLDVWAVDDQIVWAVGSKNVILKTIDGGKTWMQVQAPANNPDTELSSIYIVNQTDIWISGSGGSVYHSTDNGNTWTMFDQTFFHNGFMQGIWAITPQKVYVVGSFGNAGRRGFIGYTSDGGATWDSVSPSNNYNKHQWIGVTSSQNTIVVYGLTAHLMASTDGGTTWKNDSLRAGGGNGGGDINDFIMINPQTWWAAIDMGQIFLTNDGGSSWVSQETYQGSAFMLGIDALDSQFALAIAKGANWPPFGRIMKTVDGGTNWEVKKSYKSFLTKVSFIKQ